LISASKFLIEKIRVQTNGRKPKAPKSKIELSKIPNKSNMNTCSDTTCWKI